MTKLLPYTYHLIWLAIALTSAGCRAKDGIERVIVSGNVNFDAKPVAKGQIRFIPAGDSAGPITVETVADGYYTTESTGGVPVGTHRVEIRAYDPVVYANAPKGPGSPPIPQLLPKKYNHDSELTATLESGQSKETLDFNLTP